MNHRYVLLTLLYCAALFCLSSTANPLHFDPVFPGEDKLVHAGLYGGLAFVVSMGLRRRGWPVRSSIQFWAPILFACLYGISDEFHQSFVPGRTPEFWDVCADTVGAVIVQLALCRHIWRLHDSPA